MPGLFCNYVHVDEDLERVKESGSDFFGGARVGWSGGVKLSLLWANKTALVIEFCRMIFLNLDWRLKKYTIVREENSK